jgi:plastocyanin
MKRRLSPIVLLSLLAGTAVPLRGEDQTIQFFESSFLPQFVTVELGDVVTWVWRRGEHTVTSGDGPGDPDAGSLFDAPLDEASPSFSFQVNVFREEGYRFFCRNHPPGAPDDVGFIQVSSGERTFRVGVVDNVFLPDEVYIFEGDSIRWEHEPMEAFHTVTSGTGSADPEAGKLFDEESSDTRPIFVYRFSASGVYPYFCRPHEFLGMTGTVYVQSRFVRGDTNGDGAVDISDAVATLAHLFLGAPRRPCDDALDANDDGVLNIADPISTLSFLFVGGPEPPDPHPFRGADRTGDDLLCWPGTAN